MILERYLSRFDGDIEALVLGCTHYPILSEQIRAYLHPSIDIIDSGKEAAQKFKMYLARHPDIDARLAKTGSRTFYTTGEIEKFQTLGSLLSGIEISEARTAKL